MVSPARICHLLGLALPMLCVGTGGISGVTWSLLPPLPHALIYASVYFWAPIGSGSGEQPGIFCRTRFSDLLLLIGVVGATWGVTDT